MVSPRYFAVITLAPFASVGEMDAVAWAKGAPGAAPVTVTGLPKLEPFSRNCTLPVGSCDRVAVALLCVETVAVSVTGDPEGTVFWLAMTAAVVAACVTVIVPVAGPLALKLLSPR